MLVRAAAPCLGIVMVNAQNVTAQRVIGREANLLVRLLAKYKLAAAVIFLIEYRRPYVIRVSCKSGNTETSSSWWPLTTRSDASGPSNLVSMEAGEEMRVRSDISG